MPDEIHIECKPTPLPPGVAVHVTRSEWDVTVEYNPDGGYRLPQILDVLGPVLTKVVNVRPTRTPST